MLSEYSEAPLKQVAANIIGTEGGRGNNMESNSSSRKVNK
jgi:hypothetical protein